MLQEKVFAHCRLFIIFFLQVLLPTGTQECLDNRVDIMKRCDPDATEFDLYGDSKGACGKPHVTTQKFAVDNLQVSLWLELLPMAGTIDSNTMPN